MQFSSPFKEDIVKYLALSFDGVTNGVCMPQSSPSDRLNMNLGITCQCHRFPGL